MSDASVDTIQSVFHPTDFSPSGEPAFVHALAIALVRQARFDILHAGSSEPSDWGRFPAVRGTLERWGLLPDGSEREDVFSELSVQVVKIAAEGDPVKVCVEHIQNREPDIVVLATEGREGLSAWLRPSVSQRIARRSASMTLFVPKGTRGFVDVATGDLRLHRILVPVAAEPDPHEALVRVTRAAEALGEAPVEITLLHVGSQTPARRALPQGDAWTWRERREQGEIVPAIVAAAAQADLVAMVTEGRDGFLDALRGSVTEQVVNSAPCPVLAIPAS